MNSDGKHEWFVPVLVVSSCIFDVAKFPFDYQSCSLKFTAWTHDQTELDLDIDTRPVVTGTYVNSTEWDVVSIERKRKSSKYKCCPNNFVDIRYFKFKSSY